MPYRLVHPPLATRHAKVSEFTLTKKLSDMWVYAKNFTAKTYFDKAYF
jgi:hypothetical protein